MTAGPGPGSVLHRSPAVPAVYLDEHADPGAITDGVTETGVPSRRRVVTVAGLAFASIARASSGSGSLATHTGDGTGHPLW